MPVTTRTVRPADGEIRLDRWFHRHFPQLTQGALQKMLRTGQIRVDGQRAEANTRLLPGQAIRVPPMPDAPAPKAEPKPVDPREAAALERLVIYRDGELAGATGTLRLDGFGNVVRQPQWSIFSGGVPVPMAGGAAVGR